MNVVATLIIFFAFFLPFQFALRPAEGVDLAIVRVIVPTVTLLWLFVRLMQRRVHIPVTAQTALFLSFLFFSALSLFAASQIALGARKLAFLLSLAPLYFVAWDIFTSSLLWRKKVLAALVGGAVAAALVGCIQFSLQFFVGSSAVVELWRSLLVFFLGPAFAQAVSMHPSVFVHVSGQDILRASAFFPDPHMMAFYTGMLLPFAVAFFSVSGSRAEKFFYAVCAAVLFFGDALTFSRGGYVGLLGGGISALLLLRDRLLIKNPSRVLLALPLIILFVATLFASPFGARLFSILDFSEGSNQGRIATWTQALAIIEQHPIAGIGIGNYAYSVDPSASSRAPFYAHNLYLDIAAESGIIAALLWIGILLCAFFAFARNKKRDPFAVAGAVSIVIFSVHAFFEMPLYSVHILPLLLIILAFSATHVVQSRHGVRQ